MIDDSAQTTTTDGGAPSHSTPTRITPIADRRITKQTERILASLMTDPTAEWSGAEIAPLSKLKSGTLYPALIRMHRFGWLSWRWEDVEPAEAKRPRKRLYRLTAEGERFAQELTERTPATAQTSKALKQPPHKLRPVPRGLIS